MRKPQPDNVLSHLDSLYAHLRKWGESIVPVFIERFLIVVCAAAFYGLIVNNSMNLNSLQRAGLGMALVGVALFLGATVSKSGQSNVAAPKAAPPSINTTTGPESPIMPDNGGDVTISNDDSKPAASPPKDRPK